MATINAGNGGGQGAQGGQGPVRQSPRLARQALLRAPIDHVGVQAVGDEFSRARVYPEPVECCLNADRTFVGVWSARGGLLARALFHPGAVQADVSRAARSLRHLVVVAHTYLTTAGAQVGNPKELGLAKSALKRLGDKYSPTLHLSARSAVLVADLPAFWRSVCDAAAQMDRENDQLHTLCLADANGPPVPFFMTQALALPNPAPPQPPQAPLPVPQPAPAPLPVPVRPPVVPVRPPPQANILPPPGAVMQQGPPAPPARPNGNPVAAPVPGNPPARNVSVAARRRGAPAQGPQGNAPARRGRAGAGPAAQQGGQQPAAANRRRRRSPSTSSGASSDSSDSTKRPRRQ